MSKLLEVFQGQLVKGLQRAPGWAPLLAVWYALILQPDPLLPPTVRGVGLTLPLFGRAFWVVGFTAIAYVAGDSWDDWAYDWIKDRLDTTSLDAAKKAAQSTLQVRDGSYAVAFAVLRAAKRAAWTSMLNEMAKFIRSLCLPLVVLAGWLALESAITGGVVSLALAILCAVGYVPIKLAHQRVLYEQIPALHFDPDLSTLLVDGAEGQARLFFWESRWVATGPASP